MMKCPSCSKEIMGNRKFCTFCGAKLPDVKYCPTCGAILARNKKFCENCGAQNQSYTQPNVSYPVYSHNSSPENTYDDASLQDSTLPIEGANESVFRELNATVRNSEGLAPDLNPNDSNPTQSNLDQVSHQVDDGYQEDEHSDDLPVYEDLENENSSSHKIGIVILLVVLAGGVLLLGQRLNWWHIGALSWVGGDYVQSEAFLSSETNGEEVSEEIVENRSDMTVETDEKTPFSMSLIGYVDDKYGVEMFINGYKTSEGLFPENGKYRYTKYNNGVWIDLNFEVKKADDFRMYEYTDGNFTGTWDVYFDGKSDSIIGSMTNSKGDTYPVKLKATYQDSLDVYTKFKESIPTFKDIYLSLLGQKKINYEDLGFSKTVKSRIVGDNDDTYQIDDVFYRLELDSEHYCEISSITYMEAEGYTLKIVGFPDLMNKYCEEAIIFKSSPDFLKYGSEIYIKDGEIEWGIGDGY